MPGVLKFGVDFGTSGTIGFNFGDYRLHSCPRLPLIQISGAQNGSGGQSELDHSENDFYDISDRKSCCPFLPALCLLMNSPKSDNQINALIDPILGYLNFASGSFDANFFSNLNRLFGSQPQPTKSDEDVPAVGEASLANTTAGHCLVACHCRLAELSESNSTFRDAVQCRFVLDVVLNDLLPGYRRFHSDLLFHQSDEFLFNSFFVGRAMEQVLRQIQLEGLDSQSSFESVDRDDFCQRVLGRLNDFIGHRPVASLETQKLEPYAHEYVRPVPVFIDGAGVAAGKYQRLITETLQIISRTNPHILRAAHFAPDKLVELAIDPRAFDFDHPINQRPNHHFGTWDEHSIDGDGYYHRFIVHQVTLDALLERVEELADEPTIASEEAILEAASALACTMLMGSGISGCSPSAHDSNTTLSTLISTIAAYRDQFYQELIPTLSPTHQQRMLEEIEIRHQPMGAVRQDLNARLAQRRATQLVNCRLAAIFARMGYPAAAEKQSSVVPVAAARITCQIDCLLSAGNDMITAGDLNGAYLAVGKIMNLLHLGIECGAIVDPWNIIGFDANYSLFPALEDTVRDHRIYDLLDVMDRLFAMLSQLCSEAAATNDGFMLADLQNLFREIVDWWRKFAAHEVSSVGAVDPEDLFEAASVVAVALNLWHKGGAAAGDMEFWAPHAELLDSPKAYSLVINALMQRADYQTASALLVHWISQSDLIPLEYGDSSFHNLMFRWIVEQTMQLNDGDVSIETRLETWNRIRKFYDFLEANAGDYWAVPDFQPGKSSESKSSSSQLEMEFDDEEDFLPDDDVYESDEDEGLYRAAYEQVTFNDSTDDGVEGDIHDGGLDQPNQDLDSEVDRVLERLEFLNTLAAYWNVAAKIPLPVKQHQDLDENNRNQLKRRRDFIIDWAHQASANRRSLLKLLDKINAFKLTINGSDRDSMLAYDQQRVSKEMLLENTITTCIETENAIRMLVAVIKAIDFLLAEPPVCNSSDDEECRFPPLEDPLAPIVEESAPVVNVYAALLLNNEPLIEHYFSPLVEYLHSRTLLYVPLSKGGKPASIVGARVIQTAILELLQRLPANGRFGETYELTKTTLDMERNNPVGGGAVTEFDEIFEVAYSSMVQSLVRSTALYREQLTDQGELEPAEIKKQAQKVLFDCVEMLTESTLPLWLAHSKTLRLSVLEKVRKPQVWERFVEFIHRYGEGLFTQSFFYLPNVRAILHQGVDAWLRYVQESPNVPDLRLLDELGSNLPRETAVRFLTIVLESVRENFNEYVDYNTTTTQSDHGNQLDSFLDFLRLRSRYDRVCWRLKPVVWAHRILVHEQENGVARMWRRSLTERIGPKADEYLDDLQELRKKYSIQMNSVARRIEGRFAHQLQIDRLRALVGPSMERPRTRESSRAFELLVHEAQAFLRSTSGVGVDLPEWLAELENEVHQFLLPTRLRDFWHEPDMIDQVPIPIAQLREKLEKLPQNEHEL